MQKAILYDGKIKKIKPTFTAVYPFNIKVDMVFPWEFTTVMDIISNTKGHGKAAMYTPKKLSEPVWTINQRAEYFYFLVSRTVSGDSPALA